MTRRRKHEDIDHLPEEQQRTIRKQRWLQDMMSDPHQAEVVRERNRHNKQAQRERARQAKLDSNNSEPPQKRVNITPASAMDPQPFISQPAHTDAPTPTAPLFYTSVGVGVSITPASATTTWDPQPCTPQPVHIDASVSMTPPLYTSIGVITDSDTPILPDFLPSACPATPPTCPSALSDLTDVGLDLATDLIGSQVPKQSETVKWSSGHTTILPCIIKDGVNICEDKDLRFVKYLAQLPESTGGSENVVHVEYGDIHNIPLYERVASALSIGKAVVIRGVARPSAAKNLTVDYLEEFGISRNMAVAIHDVEARINDFQYPHKSGTVGGFIQDIDDPSKIQCILDVPLAHMGLTRDFWLLDHGIVYGWNQSTKDCPVLTDHVHPDNFITRSWGLLHQGGYVTFPHQDADGANTFVEMQFGIKQWALFWPKDEKGRAALSKAKMDLASMSESDEGGSGWFGEVVMLNAGDMLFQPPGQMHAVYTPVPSFTSGGHFFHYNTMHLTEASRYVDSKNADYLTNQAHGHALETFQRMVIAIPRLPPNLYIHSGSLTGLCIMVLQPKLYKASNSDEKKVRSSNSTKQAVKMCSRFLTYYSSDIEAVKRKYRAKVPLAGECLTLTDVVAMLSGSGSG